MSYALTCVALRQWELASAVSHFTISYAVALWYYTPKPKAYEIGQRIVDYQTGLDKLGSSKTPII